LPFGDTRIFGFSTDRDVPLLITTNAEDISGKENAKESRRNKTSKPMIESSN